jgi:hypothetical protein
MWEFENEGAHIKVLWIEKMDLTLCAFTHFQIFKFSNLYSAEVAQLVERQPSKL